MAVILFIHRYLGLAVGVVMTLWCLSGFVMMYQSMPSLTAEERVQGLEPLNLAGCCDLSKVDILDDETVSDFRVEMLNGQPIIRLPDLELIYNLRTGQPVGELTPEQMQGVASAWGAGAGVNGRPGTPELIEIDQWTIQSARRNAPVYRIDFDDPDGTRVYVAAKTGQVIQDVNRKERILAWLGAIPHWLYPTILRQNGQLWTEVVIWSSIVGVFLTVTGIFVGIIRFKPRASGRWSPYRGLFWWHHILGLVFGVLTLTWTFSGLLTMGPWNVLQNNAGGAAQSYAGDIPWLQAKQLIAALPQALPAGARQVDAAPAGGALHAVVMGSDASPVRRLGPSGAAAPVTEAEVRRIADGLDEPVAEVSLIDEEDDYYYGHHVEVHLPVWRIHLADPAQTHLYVDPRTGSVVRAVDRPGRTRRWLETGLHDMDFAWIRSRPIWDIVVLPLLAGVTIACFTGTWMAWRRLKRDLAAIRWRRRKAPHRTEEGVETGQA
jgi:uncharacterized iron-regulated membrane protein